MNICWFDCETYCDLDLKLVGSYKYAEHCEILLNQYAWNDGEVYVHDFTEDPVFPYRLIEMLDECDAIGAHNGILFDRVVMKNSVYAPFFPDNKRWLDTMVRAYSHSLPGALGTLCEIFKLPVEEAKDREGKKLVRLFCCRQPKNSKIKRATRLTHPKDWEAFKHYAKMDIIAERAIHNKIPVWNETPLERELQDVDMRMNDRGFFVDLEFNRNAIELLTAEKAEKNRLAEEKTDGAIHAATQRDALLEYILNIWDISLPDMRKSTLERRLDDQDIPEVVKDLIRLRLEVSGTSTRKYQAMIDYACKDGRIRGVQQFRGAHRTGRWGGRGIQPHNMPRQNKKELPLILAAVEMVKQGGLDFIYDGPKAAMLSKCLRCSIVASNGAFSIADLSAIEGRSLAYLANEEWKLEAYRKYDAGIGDDIYKLTYATTFGCDVSEVGADERQLGKVLELALGYGGGVGAFVTFSLTYGINLSGIGTKMIDRLPEWAVDGAEAWWRKSLERGKVYKLDHDTFIACDAIKRMWRSANPATVRFWSDLEEGAKAVIQGKDGLVRTAGKVRIDRKGTWMRMQLPSGRYLSYPGVKVSEEGKITYLGVNTYSRKWCNLGTYGGKLAENATQGFAADIFGNGLVLADAAGYQPVLGVHDELLADKSGVDLVKIMTTVPSWAVGLPLAAEGFESYRYRKG